MTIPNLAQGWQLAAEFRSNYLQDEYVVGVLDGK
jgi:hypothetical protein